MPLPPTGKIEILPSTITIRDAIKFLHDKNILSAPVRDVTKPDSATWKEKYLGVVDVVEIVMVMLSAMEEQVSIEEVDETAESDSSHPVNIHPLATAFVDRPLTVMAGFSETSWFPFMPLELDATLLDAIVLLGTYRIKRIPLISGQDGDIVNIVTQSSILHQLVKHLSEYTAVAAKTLEQLELAAPSEVFSVRADQCTKDAFDIIRKHNVSAVPVLGYEGGLVGNISARHVYYIITGPNKLRLLKMKASEFLATVHDEQGGWNIRNTAITCKASDTLAHVMTVMDAAHIHRIYLCDDHRRPYRVISLCDVLAKFVTSPDTGCCLL